MKKLNTFILICLGVLLTNCDIKDSLKDCVYTSNINLSFEYFADESSNVVEKHLNSAKLYIYADNGLLYNIVGITQNELTSHKSLDLPIGKYSLVCWGNQGTYSEISNENDIDLARLSPDGYSKGRITTNDNLYFGKKNISITAPNSTVRETLKFESANIQFIVNAHNFGSKDLSVTIENLMPQYNFNMEPTKGYEATYNPVMSNENSKMKTFLAHSLRFKNNNNIKVKLYDSNNMATPLKAIVLKELLEQENISVENKQEVTLYINFKNTTNGIIVSISDWDEEDIILGN